MLPRYGMSNCKTGFALSPLALYTFRPCSWDRECYHGHSLSRIKLDTRVELKWVDPGKDDHHEAGLWAIIDGMAWKLLVRN